MASSQHSSLSGKLQQPAADVLVAMTQPGVDATCAAITEAVN